MCLYCFLLCSHSELWSLKVLYKCPYDGFNLILKFCQQEDAWIIRIVTSTTIIIIIYISSLEDSDSKYVHSCTTIGCFKWNNVIFLSASVFCLSCECVLEHICHILCHLQVYYCSSAIHNCFILWVRLSLSWLCISTSCFAIRRCFRGPFVFMVQTNANNGHQSKH